ncbi:MAG TPA: folylpolyglutamate synthase/dihydrofolate synthase family protein [Salinivirgaceae bacterium]|nr:folylpolyglutamate synthase/dihydrofolate synthase family protein [Salinivirgaceae bacterium]
MNYSETLEFLFSQLPMFQRIGGAAYKADLSTTKKLDELSGHPHRRFRTIHVAGTNGKGSVSHMIAMALQQAGYKTGLYTSPHLIDFRERIKINGDVISEQYVIDWVERYRHHFDGLKPSFFEMTVAMAFDYFADQKVDVAVIEVGMGGRLDSTNIITPELSVITNIGLDHTQFLGTTLSAIAEEKAGIIKTEVPVVIGEFHPDTLTVFERKASQAKAPLYKAFERFVVQKTQITEEGTQLFTLRSLPDSSLWYAEVDLLGMYQIKNIVTVATALEQMKIPFALNLQESLRALKHTSKVTGLMGRWQILCEKPKVVTDIAHNADGIKQIAEILKTQPYKQIHMILGVVNDKDAAAMIRLLPKNAYYYFTQPSIPRAMPVEKLVAIAEAEGYNGQMFPTVEQAYNHVMKIAQPSDMIYVGGSAFVVADILTYLKH